MNQSDEQEKTDSTSPWKVLFLSLSAYVVVSSLVIVAFVSFFGVDKWSDIANTASTIVQATLAAAVIFGASMAANESLGHVGGSVEIAPRSPACPGGDGILPVFQALGRATAKGLGQPIQ